ncbi:LGFP repeat-containing protein [Yinghuangia seranimata]|uniref:LGFP repeat-containing protein n=1 Tax=Yinghuangia seranimata TaxID=408067 RepID=UPI00248C650C|nr:hypothetical protein [Yinghuangia seranimata]MDI2132831.1 hypothetical protein [Yinghuangia seranimata]
MGDGQLRFAHRIRVGLAATATTTALAATLLTATPAGAAEPVVPDTPTDLTVSPTPQNGTDASFCGWIGDTYSIALTARLTIADSPDGERGLAEGIFRLQDTSVPGSEPVEFVSSSLPTGYTARFAAGSLIDGHTYSWTVQARSARGGALSETVAGCSFGVDKKAPGVTVTSTDWTANGDGPKTAGQSGVIRVQAAPGSEAEIRCFRIAVSQSPVGEPCTATPDASGGYDYRFTPRDAGSYVLNVQAVDHAGNIGSASYTFFAPPRGSLPSDHCSVIGDHRLCGPLLDRYNQLKSTDRYFPAPGSDVLDAPDGNGKFVGLTDGSVLLWSQATGAHLVAARPWAVWWGAQSGGKNAFGYPTEDIPTYSTTGYAPFEHGAVYWNPSDPNAPTHFLNGPSFDRIRYVNSATYADAPAQDTALMPDGVGQRTVFKDYTVFWHPSTYAVKVYNPLVKDVEALGGVGGWLGYPTYDDFSTQSGRIQGFQARQVYWSPETGAHTVFGGIGARWDFPNNDAKLGLPISEESDLGDGTGRKQTFAKGTITWSAKSGAHIVTGDIATAWGAAPAAYGAAVTDELVAPDGVGRYQVFERVRFYWTPTTGAHELHGGILDKWWQYGGERGFLGYPTTNEGSIGNGRYNDFERGGIYWSASTGAHELHGGIRQRWLELGGPGGLGFPVTDELGTADGRGRYVVFERGSIFWTATTGAVEIYGGINDAWASQGWNSGPLGYPTRGEYSIPGGRRADFEHGYITWTAAGGKTEIHYA